MDRLDGFSLRLFRFFIIRMQIKFKRVQMLNKQIIFHRRKSEQLASGVLEIREKLSFIVLKLGH